MQRRRTIGGQAVWLGLCCALLLISVLKADDEPTWDLLGLHGTSTYIAHMVNSQLEDAWNRAEEARQNLARNLKQVSDYTAVARESARHSEKYKTEQLIADAAKHDLDAARAASDNAAALDAGARYNQSRERLNQMELAIVRTDPNVNRAKSFTAGYENECKGIDEPIVKAAKWRCKQVMVIKNSYNCIWPVEPGNEILVQTATVLSVKNDEVVLGIIADEPMEFKKDFAGDGIGLATYREHKVGLRVKKPDGFLLSERTEEKIDRCFVIGEKQDPVEIEGRRAPCYAATESTQGKLAVLIAKLNDVKGPPKTFMDKIDAEVNSEMDKKIKEAQAGEK